MSSQMSITQSKGEELSIKVLNKQPRKAISLEMYDKAFIQKPEDAKLQKSNKSIQNEDIPKSEEDKDVEINQTNLKTPNELSQLKMPLKVSWAHSRKSSEKSNLLKSSMTSLQGARSVIVVPKNILIVKKGSLTPDGYNSSIVTGSLKYLGSIVKLTKSN